MEQIPHELIEMIYGMLDGKSTGRLAMASKGFAAVAPKQLIEAYKCFSRVVTELEQIKYYHGSRPGAKYSDLCSIRILHDAAAIYRSGNIIDALYVITTGIIILSRVNYVDIYRDRLRINLSYYYWVEEITNEQLYDTLRMTDCEFEYEYGLLTIRSPS